MEAQTGTRTSPPQPSMSISCSCSCPAMAIFNLVLRTLTFLLLLIALILLTTASFPQTEIIDYFDYHTVHVHFNYFYAYRYVLYTIIIGMVYALLQTGLAIFLLATGKLHSFSSFLIQFDFYADKFISYTLATGAAAAFGLTIDAKRVLNSNILNSFWDKTTASASLLLLGFICSALSSIFSSLALSKGSSSIVVQRQNSHPVGNGDTSEPIPNTEEIKENIVEQQGSSSSAV